MSRQLQGPTGAWNAAPPLRDRPILIVGLATLVFISAVGAFCTFAVRHADAVYAEFMDGCERDHKHYECMLLWRASRRDDPVVVPVPIPIPR